MSDSFTFKTNLDDGDIAFCLSDGSTPIRPKADGRIFVRGVEAAADKEVVDGLRAFVGGATDTLPRVVALEAENAQLRTEVAKARRDGMIAALDAGIARAQQGWVKNPFPSMKPTEVKQMRDDMQGGAIQVFGAIREAIRAEEQRSSTPAPGSADRKAGE